VIIVNRDGEWGVGNGEWEVRKRPHSPLPTPVWNLMAIGYLSLILHAHLPFVRHPEYPDFLEEDWLYEAISETYIPLLVAFNHLREEGLKYGLTLSMPPPLCEMLCDPLLQERYLRHINRLSELAEKEVERTGKEAPHFHSAALMYRGHFNECREV